MKDSSYSLGILEHTPISSQRPVALDSRDGNLSGTPNRSIDVGASTSDSGIIYTMINASAKCAGFILTPKQIVILLRFLKATTFCFLFLNIFSELMFLFFVAFMNAHVYSDGTGSIRDYIIRINGIFLSMIALSIELDLEFIRLQFSGFRSYIPRSLLLLLISAISDVKITVDNYAIDDDSTREKEIPGSAIVFDEVTSFVLYVFYFYFVFRSSKYVPNEILFFS